MANGVQLDTTAAFTGGLNLRADQLKVEEGQSPWMLNMDVDPSFGARSRRGWVDWQTVAATSWNPRALYSHVLGDGSEWQFVSNTIGLNGELWASDDGGAFVKAPGVVASAVPHGADFAPWGSDLYVACGTANVGQEWSDGTWTALTDAASNWSNDYTAPVGGQMPKADFVAIHDGYLWVASTLEGGNQHPHRLRFSHPNDPDSWALLDFIDFPEGGGPITGIVPYRDHLLVFFPSAVWALYGSNPDTFAKANVTKTVGASNRQCLTRSESNVYFVSWPDGVYSIGPDSVTEVSESLRPSFKTGGDFNQDASLQWLGWANQKLYWSVPYNENGAPTSATSVFVLDPSLGAWMLWRAGSGVAIAPITGSASSGTPLGCSRAEATVVRLDAVEVPTDTLNGVAIDFPTVLRTPWQDSGYPTIKKRWKRPDLIVRETDIPYELTLHIFHNLEETAARRTRTMTFTPKSSGLFWVLDPQWDGTDASLETPPAGGSWDDNATALWGTPAKGSSLERSGGLGNASSIQMELHGELGKTWGLTALIWKSIMRRIR